MVKWTRLLRFALGKVQVCSMSWEVVDAMFGGTTGEFLFYSFTLLLISQYTLDF